MFKRSQKNSEKTNKKFSILKILLWLGIGFFSIVLIIAIAILSWEVFAPVENKLSSYLNEDYPRPLVADNTYDVIVLKECDLAIKYNKKHTVEEFKLQDVLAQAGTQNGLTIKSIIIKNDSGSVSISCMVTDSLETSNQKTSSQASKSTPDVSKLTFFTKASRNYLEKNKASVGGIFITVGNKNYIITPSPGAKDFDLQMQFDSLAPSKASVTDIKISNQSTNTQSSSSQSSLAKNDILTNPDYQKTTPTAPFVADDQYDVVVLKTCDLAIKYNKKYKFSTANKHDSDLKLEIVEQDKKSNYLPGYIVFDCGHSSPAESQYGKERLKSVDTSKTPFLTRVSKQNVDTSYEKSNLIGNDLFSQIYFKGKNQKSYFLIEISSKNDYKHDFEIQIDSLAPSTPSVKLEEKPKLNSSSSSAKSSPSN